MVEKNFQEFPSWVDDGWLQAFRVSSATTSVMQLTITVITYSCNHQRF
jgi:hypothetical protein